MTQGDLPQVLAIEEASFPRPFSQKLFETELQLSIAHLYVAKEETVLAGYIDFWDAGAEIHLINIAVHPERRHQGIGARLMERLLDYANQNRVGEIYLDVRVSNKTAIALYVQFGFKEISIRKGYYQDNNEDALLMSLMIPLPAADKQGGSPGVVEKNRAETNGAGS